MSVKKTLKYVFLITVLISTSTLAHDIYIWPSYFNLNKNKSSTVSVNLTASNTTYRPDRSIPNIGLTIINPKGKKIRPVGGFFQAKTRSIFDVAIKETGTYALRYDRKPAYYTIYKVENEKKRQFKRIDKTQKNQLPENAQNIKSILSTSTAYITNKLPNQEVFKPDNKGLELIPVTHPADYVTNDNLIIKLLLDGNPIKGVKVTVELEGSQYRKNPEALKVK